MKKILFILPLIALMAISTNVQAQKRKPAPAQKTVKQDIRTKSKVVLNRNLPVLQKAKKSLSVGKNYTGDFALAVRHQKHARHLHNSGKFQKALYHARVARAHAAKCIKANGQTPDRAYNIKAEDASFYKDAPSDADLDNALPAEKMSDTDAMDLRLEELGLK